ncbi:MAG: hypothetical protein HY000_37030 [Planctomycetes bacterium]|nr:hypothetical protein [Planctomycetota bacterium]
MPTSMDRRQFGKTLSALIASTGLAAASQTTSAAQQADQPAQPPSEADLFLQVVKARWGERLSKEQLKELRKQIEQDLGGSKRLSAFPLTNADEPAPVFAAYRSS